MAQFDDTLPYSLGVPNEVGRDGQFSIPSAARRARVVIGQVGEGNAPTVFVEPCGKPTVADVARAHESMKQKDSRGVLIACREKAHTHPIVFRVASRLRRIPLDPTILEAWALGRRQAVILLTTLRTTFSQIPLQILD